MNPDPTADLNRFAKSRFDAAVAQTFSFEAFDANGGAVSVPLRLDNVQPRKSPPGLEQFAACFVGPANPALAQGSYNASSTAFGSDHLFVVPIGFADGARLYEVCVARHMQHD